MLHNSDTTHKRSHELRFYGLSVLCSKLITVSHKSNFYTRFDVSRELLHEIWLNGEGMFVIPGKTYQIFVLQNCCFYSWYDVLYGHLPPVVTFLHDLFVQSNSTIYLHTY